MIKRVKKFKPTRIRFMDDKIEFIYESHEDHMESGVLLRDYRMYIKKGFLRPKQYFTRCNIEVNRIIEDFGYDFLGRQNRVIHEIHEGFTKYSPQKDAHLKRLLDERARLHSRIAQLEGHLALSNEKLLTSENDDKFKEREMEHAHHARLLREEAAVSLAAAVNELQRSQRK